jgi:hypothetical protein
MKEYSDVSSEGCVLRDVVIDDSDENDAVGVNESLSCRVVVSGVTVSALEREAKRPYSRG